MRRFILIDHSIKGFGGHHYEYAVHVLNAAHEAGFKTVLAVNRDFKSGNTRGSAPWEIVPAYEHGFWRAAAAPPAAAGPGWRAKLFDLKTRIRYGPVGRFLWTLPEFRYHYTPATIFHEYRGKPQFFPMLAGLVLIKYPYSVIQSLHFLLRVIIAPLREYLIRIGLAMLHLLVMILYPLRLFKHLWLFKSLFFSRCVEAHHEFGRDTDSLFQKIGLQQDDIVFVPTLSEKDMLGLQEFLNNNSQAHRASWHLLFRRNLFDGPGPREVLALGHRPQTLSAFRQFNENLNGNAIRLYTDTDRLSEEYNCLGSVRFHTLPIPINPAFVERSHSIEHSLPLRIVYAGDARSEKGYHQLPDLVRDLGSTGHVDDVAFNIQSNMAQARVEDATAERLALHELESIGSDRVRLLRVPLDSNEYLALVSSADILLILYDARNYYSRSSGILVEAFAAGIPVIVPADSWMGQQLASATYAYLSRAESKASVIDRHIAACWSAIPVPQKPPLKPKTSNIRAKRRDKRVAGNNALLISTPAGHATHLLLKFEKPSQTGLEVLVRASQSVGDRRLCESSRLLHALSDHAHCFALFELHSRVDTVALEFFLTHGNASCALSHLEAVFLRQGSEPLHTDAVGRAYLPSDSIAHHVSELIDHYDHYRRTACEYAVAWNHRHSATRLIGELMA
jgi:glycosyltransferase involved in cell wall biosynthesis